MGLGFLGGFRVLGRLEFLGLGVSSSRLSGFLQDGWEKWGVALQRIGFTAWEM